MIHIPIYLYFLSAKLLKTIGIRTSFKLKRDSNFKFFPTFLILDPCLVCRPDWP